MIALLPSSAWAQITPVADPQVAALKEEARDYRIAGWTMIGTGLTMQVLGHTALADKAVVCGPVFNLIVCDELVAKNMGAIYGGLALALSGVVFTFIGDIKAKRAKRLMPDAFLVTPAGWRVSKTIAF